MQLDGELSVCLLDIVLRCSRWYAKYIIARISEGKSKFSEVFTISLTMSYLMASHQYQSSFYSTLSYPCHYSVLLLGEVLVLLVVQIVACRHSK
jgi:hypothetical protein